MSFLSALPRQAAVCVIALDSGWLAARSDATAAARPAIIATHAGSSHPSPNTLPSPPCHLARPQPRRPPLIIPFGVNKYGWRQRGIAPPGGLAHAECLGGGMCFRGSPADYTLNAAKVVLSGSAARTMRGGRGIRQLHHAVGGMEERKKGEKKKQRSKDNEAFRKYKGEKNVRRNHQPVFDSKVFMHGWSHADPSVIGNFGLSAGWTNRLVLYCIGYVFIYIYIQASSLETCGGNPLLPALWM